MSEYSDLYYSHLRQPLVAMVDFPCHLLLDVGCGSGQISESLKIRGLVKKAFGIEMNYEASEKARKVLDDVTHCDLNSLSTEEFDCLFNGSNFDCVILGDILEHFSDPWAQLRRISNRLIYGGVVVASIPNIRHWSVLFPLLFRGEFSYKNEGIMDRGHLRFFTKKSILKLFLEIGLQVEYVRPNIWSNKQKLFDDLTLGFFTGFLANQWLVRAKKL